MEAQESNSPPPLVASPTHSVALGVLDAFVDGARILFRQPLALFAAAAIACLVCGILVALSFIPFALILTVPALVLWGAPLATRLVSLNLRVRAGQRIRVREVWNIGKASRKRLAGAFLSLTLLSLLLLSIGVAVVGLGMAQGSKAEEMTPGIGAVILVGAAGAVFLGILPWAYGGFAPSLVAEHGLGLSEALRRSWRQTSLQPVRSLIFAIACALLLASGLLLGGLGLLFVVPWVCASRARMHEALFGLQHAPAGQPT